MRNLLFLLLLFFAMSVQAGSEQIISMVKHDTATFYVSVAIGDQPMQNFVVDTGASHVTITRGTLEALLDKQQAVFLRHMIGVLADGSSIEVPIYRISSLNIGGECRFENIEVAIMEGNVRCVLGLSVLNQAAPFTFKVDPPQIQLSGCDSTKK